MRWCLLLLNACLASAQLVGPGGMVPHSGGGGGGPRFGGYVRISEPVLGFFIAGSSLDELNGVYGPRLTDYQAAELPTEIAETVIHGAYRHHKSGWLLAHVSTRTEGMFGGMSQEWVLFDENNRERFANRGNNLIPSSGKQWSHLHRDSRAPAPAADGDAEGGPPHREQADSSGPSATPSARPKSGSSSSGSSSSSTQVRASTGDDDDQLPWQVIGIRALVLSLGPVAPLGLH